MPKHFGQQIWEIIKFTLLTLVIVIPIRTYIAQPFIVSGASMAPTFDDNQYLIVDELTYHFQPAARGEVVVFRYPKDPEKFFIKRIIGLPGETVTIQTGQIHINANGSSFILDESYLTEQPPLEDLTVTLGPGEYFVLGDNRSLSLDSRSWGPLPADHLTGRVFLRLFPFNKIGLWPGAADL